MKGCGGGDRYYAYDDKGNPLTNTGARSGLHLSEENLHLNEDFLHKTEDIRTWSYPLIPLSADYSDSIRLPANFGKQKVLDKWRRITLN